MTSLRASPMPGIVVAFVRIGMGARFETGCDLAAMIKKLRASIVSDPAGKRGNTRNDTPAVIHTQLVAGERVEITIAAKGGGPCRMAWPVRPHTLERRIGVPWCCGRDLV